MLPTSPHLQHATLLMSQQKFDLAANKLREAIAADPAADLPHGLLAICLSRLKRGKEAELAARRAVELGPDSDFCHYALAVVLVSRKKSNEALAAANRAVELDPDDSANWYALALVHLSENRLQPTIEAADRGLVLDPEDSELRALREAALTRQGSRTASTDIRATLARDPESDWAHANLGWALLNEGKRDEAVSHFREALRLDPDFGYARDGLLEALKARSVLYRPILKYYAVIKRFSSRQQTWLVFAVIAGFLAIRYIANNVPALAPYAHLLRALLGAAFMFLVFGEALLNLVLRFDPIGRYALSPHQSRYAVVLGLIAVPTAAASLMWALTSSPAWNRLMLLLLPLCLGAAILSDVTREVHQKLGHVVLVVCVVLAIALGIHYLVFPLGIKQLFWPYIYAALLGPFAIWLWDTFGRHED